MSKHTPKPTKSDSLQITFTAWQVREATGPQYRDGSAFYARHKDIADLDREAFFVVTLDQKIQP